jgi:F-type H+-transporting ATPase subunit c
VDHTVLAQAGTVAASNVNLIKSAALLGAGFAALGVAGSGIGIGLAGAGALEGMARQPEMAGKLLTNTLIIAALMEALGLMAFATSMLLYFYGSSI